LGNLFQLRDSRSDGADEGARRYSVQESGGEIIATAIVQPICNRHGEQPANECRNLDRAVGQQSVTERLEFHGEFLLSVPSEAANLIYHACSALERTTCPHHMRVPGRQRSKPASDNNRDRTRSSGDA
jgi:hypothetical protein